MAITRLGGANAISGTIPQGNIANASLGAVTALPAGVGGKVLQLVTSTTSTTVSVTGSAVTDTGLTANITPSATSSKIAIFANISSVLKFGADMNIDINLLRDSSIISSFCQDLADTGNSDYFSIGNQGVSFLDTPSSTSELTYKVNFSKSSGSGTARVQ